MPSLKIIFNLFYPPTDQLKKFIEDNKSSDGVYFPINGGSTLDDEWSENFLQKDSVGDNISHLNSILNEMTSIYWFWKNTKLPDYVGFSHYRRTFNQSDFQDYQDYDIIVSRPIWSSDKISLAHQYKHYHVLSDLQTCIDVIRDKFSYGWGEGFRKYLLNSGVNLAPCNMFIMKRELFEEWCNFVFPILFVLKEEICDSPDFQNRDNYQKRALCFLTERMFGYWYFMKKNSGLKTKEIDIVEHLDYKPENVNERGDFSKKLPRVALVAIAKDEENYLKEWVDYNLKIGFTDIYVYQNRWRYERGDIDNKRVHFEIFDNERPQIPCYNMCLEKYKGMYDFIAFFDIDEFLYIKSGETVPEFLSKYTDKEAIYINWRLFGDNGLEKVEDGNYSVLNRFTRCDDKLFRLGKPILNIGKTGTSIIFNNPHILVYADNPTTELRPFDPLGKIQVKCGSLDNNTFDEPCELYHYRNKTWEETVKRRLNTTDVFWPDNFKSRTDIETIKKDFMSHNMNQIPNNNLKLLLSKKKYRYSILQYNIGNYEKIHEIQNPQDDVEYILVVDTPNIQSKTFKVIYDKELLNFSKFERCFQVRYNTFKYCTSNICICIDANTRILKSLDGLIEEFERGKYDFSLMPHPSRNNFIEEMRMWLKLKPTYEKEFVERCTKFLELAKYDLNYKGLFQTNITVKRKCKTTFDVDRMTYALLKYFGYDESSIDKDDQIAFSFVMNRYFSWCKILPLSEQVVSSEYMSACMHGTDTPFRKEWLTYYQNTMDNLDIEDIKYVFDKPVKCMYLK